MKECEKEGNMRVEKGTKFRRGFGKVCSEQTSCSAFTSWQTRQKNAAWMFDRKSFGSNVIFCGHEKSCVRGEKLGHRAEGSKVKSSSNCCC